MWPAALERCDAAGRGSVQTLMRLARRLTAFMLVSGALVPVLSAAAPSSPPWPGRPTAAPPKATNGPPPAWIESRMHSWWLAYSSYCWKTTCVDFIPPQNRPDLPRIFVKRGTPLRLHLAFPPSELSITIQRGSDEFQRTFQPSRVRLFVPSHGGILSVFARAAGGGDASYVARIRLT